MTPEQFKAHRISLGFTQRGLAKEWNMGNNGDRTIRRWEAGERPMNPIAAYCIERMAVDKSGVNYS